MKPKLKPGILLDIGCGGNKQERFVGMDKRALPGVDIIHDLEVFPYPLKDESCLTIVGSHIIEHIKPWLMLDLMNELWRLLIPDGQLALAHPYGVNTLFVQDPTHCFFPDTEVLAQSGFKNIQDINIGENVLTLNPKTMKTEFSKCCEKIDESYDGEMLHFKTKRLDLLTTPNHSIFYSINYLHEYNWHISRADDFLKLKGHHSRKGYAIIDWEGKKVKQISIPRIQDERNRNPKLPVIFDPKDFMQFMGWYLSEGCIYERKKNYGIQISQSKIVHQSNYDKIVSLIKRMGFSPNCKDTDIRFSSKDMLYYLKPIGKSNSKYIPKELKELSKELLQAMLDTLLLGDGRKNNRGFAYATISKKLADDVQEIALKCGYRVSLYQEKRNPFTYIRGKKVNQSELIYIVGISPKTDIYFPKPKKVFFDGRVKCITVEKNHIILSRRNGCVIWVGNCNPCNETTWRYFDHREFLFQIYNPKPWELIKGYPVWQATGNMEVLFKKVKDEKK